MSTKQTGFTLIELIVVIVILGILAATAVPRFADLSTDARVSAVAGVEGALRSASALVHAQALVDGTSNGIVTLEGQTVAITSGYADATAQGIGDAVDISGSSVSCDDNGGAGPYTCTIDNITNCAVEYTAGTPPTIGQVAGFACN